MKRILLLLLVIIISGGYTIAQKEMLGKIVDTEGNPLPGVNILEKGTTNGTISDLNGKYMISVSSDSAILIFSYVGFLTEEMPAGTETELNMTLLEDLIGLSEVVVVGYGTTKKSDLTGSVTSFNSEQLTGMKKTDVSQAIQGQMAGVDVRRLSSKPGAPMSIKIRGNTVIKNDNVGNDGVSDSPDDDLSKPLYVVDGIFMDDINAINPADIEKMDILKDASATAIYGSRGANGVVIITTKSGFEGKTQITYDGSIGFNQATNIPEMLNGEQYVKFVDDALRAIKWQDAINKGGTPSADVWNNLSVDPATEFIGSNEQSNVANGRYTDWVDKFQKTGVQTSHNVGVFGGSDGLIYNASVGYLKDEGVIGIEEFERYTANVGVEKKFDAIFSAGLKTYFSYSEREEGSKELFRSSFRLAPTVNPYEDNGEIKLIPDEQDQRFLNPIYEEEGAWRVNSRTTRLISNLYINIKPFDWLNFRSTFAPELRAYRYGEHRGLLTKAARNESGRTRAYFNTDFSNSYTWDNIANLDFNILSGHMLKATIISSVYYKQDEGSGIQARNLGSDSYLYYNTEGGTDVRDYSSEYKKQTLASFAGRLNYNIQEKYLFTFTGRYDGSSKLAEGEKWKFFPSAAFAWRVSEENFMGGIDWLNNLKLRLSYGESGNDNPVQPYSSKAFLNSSSYLFGTSGKTAMYINSLPNPSLGWERSVETNIGLDIGLFGGKIRLEADFYNKETKQAILDKKLMFVTGLSDGTTGNFGSVRNRGVEFLLKTVNVKTPNFSWETSINFAKNNNEILELEGENEKIPFGRHGVLEVGESITSMYAYEVDGIWQTDEVDEAAVYDKVPGQYKFVDQQAEGEDGHGVINEEDKVIVGSHDPDWTGGMTNTFRYKTFDFSFMIYTRQGVFGHSEFYQNFASHQGDGAKFNKLDLDYWTPNNQGGEYPLPKIGHPGEWYFEDMSFVKIGNIGFGYNLPSDLLEGLKISSLRVSVDVQNPFTFTDYKGPDPETGLQNSYGMAYSVRTILFGVNLKL